MSETVLALDLGTGGCKASLWDADGTMLDQVVRDYPTFHPRPGWNEQHVANWWEAVVSCTRKLVERTPVEVTGVALSGHSLGVVLLDSSGHPVEESTPIWSDSRATAEAAQIFTEISEDSWYLRTGNGFTPALYPIAKARWYANHRPEVWAATRTVVGSKDWVNLRLTGELATDHSYASGSGVYDLVAGRYHEELVTVGGLGGRLPEPCASHDQVGSLTPDAASLLGLKPGVPVFAGAVDNAAMALGSRGTAEGRLYASLGSSSWVTVTSTKPVLDAATRPFVFAHAVPAHFISALSTFSSGTSIRWLHAMIGAGLTLTELLDEGAALDKATDVPTFVPTLSGGTPLEGGATVRGALAHLDLGHGRAHLARAGMEGIAFAMRRCLDALRDLTNTDDEVLVSGGGVRHEGWNQVYADVLGQDLLRTSVDQQAAALGAATIAFVGLGLWTYADAERPHTLRATYRTDPASAHAYETRRRRFTALQNQLAATSGTFEDPHGKAK